MDIQDFLQQNAGRWMSQRTTHHLLLNRSEAAKANLVIERLSPADAQVVQLCQLTGAEATQALGGLKTTWTDGISEQNPKPQSGTSLLLLLPQDSTNQGQIITQLNQTPPVAGEYSLGEDEVLTLVTTTAEMRVEERLWFASENFRLRTNVISRQDKTHLASFCSEIRMLSQPPTPSAQTAAEAAN
ncbi:MAG: phycobiliprotein lyase [Elainella sp.]